MDHFQGDRIPLSRFKKLQSPGHASGLNVTKLITSKNKTDTTVGDMNPLQEHTVTELRDDPLRDLGSSNHGHGF